MAPIANASPAAGRSTRPAWKPFLGRHIAWRTRRNRKRRLSSGKIPEAGYSRTDYRAPHYQVKHFLLEAGFASQMVDEDTLRSPAWKDFNLALDIFAKAGHVPWVLSEGLPNADLFLGLSYSSINHAGQRTRMIGYMNVFDRYAAGPVAGHPLPGSPGGHKL
jgi:hypothetical protein